MLKKSVKITIFITCSLFVLISCSGKVKNCKLSPDYKKIAESASENANNLAETNLQSAIASCNF
tara:strand:+ start:601 stop:792 length:192 start_codon:yes stop_codon:yes gene_type:complete